jgi:monoamine oxidase
MFDDSLADLDVSLTDYLADAPGTVLARRLLAAAFFSFSGAESREMSALAMLREVLMFGGTRVMFDDPAVRVAEGTQAISLAIAATLDVRFNQLVVSVVDDGDHVVVATTDAEYHASSVVVAVPWNVLHNVAFTPLLPEVVRIESARQHAGMCRKTCFDPSSTELVTTSYAEPSAGTFPVVVNGDLRRTWMASVPFAADAMSAVASGSAWASEPSNFNSHDWCDDPAIKGSWMSPRPGQSAALEALRLCQSRVRFAGGDISSQWPGWMEGAVISGAATAHAIDVLLG